MLKRERLNLRLLVRDDSLLVLVLLLQREDLPLRQLVPVHQLNPLRLPEVGLVRTPARLFLIRALAVSQVHRELLEIALDFLLQALALQLVLLLGGLVPDGFGP